MRRRSKTQPASVSTAARFRLPEDEERDDKLAGIGYLLSLLCIPLGLIVAFILYRRGDRRRARNLALFVIVLFAIAAIIVAATS